MHEASIAQNIIDIVKENLPEDFNKEKSKIKFIKVKVGDISSVVPESLEFCFDAIKSDDVFLKDTMLEIRKIPAFAKCEECENEFEIKFSIFLCPKCGSMNTRVISGTELEVTDFLIE